MDKKHPRDISREVLEKKVLPILRRARKQMKPTTIDLYDFFNGIPYVLKSGCRWRMWPSDFSKWRTCSDYWQKWSAKEDDTSSLLEEALRKCGRRRSTWPWAGCEDDLSDR